MKRIKDIAIIVLGCLIAGLFCFIFAAGMITMRKSSLKAATELVEHERCHDWCDRRMILKDLNSFLACHTRCDTKEDKGQ